MPIVEIKILEGRSEEQIKDLVDKITDVVCTTIDAQKELVKVHVVEMQRSRYAVGGELLSNKQE